MTAGYIDVLDPVAEVNVTPRRVAKPLTSLAGKTVGYHHARGPYLQVVAFADKLGELLKDRYGVRDVVRVKSVVDNGASGWSDPNLPEIIKRVYDDYAQEVDCVIVAAAFCGGSTYWSLQAAAEFQDRGVPTVSLASSAFQDLALFTCQSRGYEELPMLILPNDFETKKPAEMYELAVAHVDDVVAILSRGEEAPAEPVLSHAAK
jgi:hypothetical protein